MFDHYRSTNPKKQEPKSDGRVGPRQAKNSGSVQYAHLFFLMCSISVWRAVSLLICLKLCAYCSLAIIKFLKTRLDTDAMHIVTKSHLVKSVFV